MNVTAQVIGFLILIAFVAAGLWKKFASSTGKLETGQNDLSSPPSDVSQWKELAKKYGSYFDIPWQIVLAQIWHESGGDPNAVGQAGELGLMQLKQIAINDLSQNGYNVPKNWETDAEANILAGIEFLDLQRKRTGSIKEALKAYNQGFEGRKNHPILATNYSQNVIRKAKDLGYNA